MIFPPRLVSLALAVGIVAAVDRPNFVGTARVKQHMHRTGELVEGEEDLLKIIVKWDSIPHAESYELCQDCDHIDEETGAETGAVEDGIIHSVGIGKEFTCGGQPCKILPGTRRGHNKFHLRVKTANGEVSAWSKHQNFDVQEPGTFGHVDREEL
ncbi:hypothetical protein ACHAXR_002027 [Thalassiosira sp. AJA248-18]